MRSTEDTVVIFELFLDPLPKGARVKYEAILPALPTSSPSRNSPASEEAASEFNRRHYAQKPYRRADAPTPPPLPGQMALAQDSHGHTFFGGNFTDCQAVTGHKTGKVPEITRWAGNRRHFRRSPGFRDYPAPRQETGARGGNRRPEHRRREDSAVPRVSRSSSGQANGVIRGTRGSNSVSWTMHVAMRGGEGFGQYA